MKKFLGLGLIFLLATGCGDLFMGKREKSGPSIQAISCKLDTKAFSKILEANIKSDIICLQQKIHIFLELVKTDRPGYISEKTLITFIQKGILDVGDGNVIPLVEGLFDLTKLILGGDRGYVSRGDFDRLIAFLIEFNKNIYPVYKIFKKDSGPDYERDREIIEKYLIIIAGEIRLLLNMERNSLDEIDIETFLERFFVEDQVAAEKIKSLMFLKRMFLGGEVLELTHVELNTALDILPKLGQVAYDVAKLKDFNFSQSMIDRVYLEDVQTIRDNLFYAGDEAQALFTVSDLLKAAETLELDLGFELSRYSHEIKMIKKVIMSDGQNDAGGEFFSSVEIVNLLNHVTKVLEEGSLFYRIYAMYQDTLDSKEPLPQSMSFSRFPVDTSTEQFYLDHFTEIANHYRFYKGGNKAPFYSYAHFRNPLAMFEIAAMEYLVKLVMQEYGSYNEAADNLYKYHLSQTDTLRVMDDLKVFLRDQGIINVGKAYGGEVKSAADNVVLMSTLFQFQSDGCSEYICVEVPEITEFLVGLFTALSIKDFFTEEMTKLCRLDADNRINPDCFRENFVKVLDAQNVNDNNRSISDYMPLLRSYITELTSKLPQGAPPTESESYMTFIKETEAFTRTCEYYDEAQTEPVFMSENDAFAVFAGMLNVESTLMKFDKNQNNKMDGFGANNEVLDAFYTTYKGAIDGLVTNSAGPFATKISRQIFQYLVKYGEVPELSGFGSVWSFVKYILFANKNADADRTTIATILKVLGEQNAGDNYFKCRECLDNKCVPLKCHEDVQTGEMICVEDPWD